MSNNSQSSLIEDYREKRIRGNQRIMSENFLPFKRFFALDSQAYSEGEIPLKYKELMGLVGSMTLRCNDCIAYHIDRCLAIGCSSDELNEAMNIALIIGGSIVIPHLRYAFEIIDSSKNREL